MKKLKIKFLLPSIFAVFIIISFFAVKFALGTTGAINACVDKYVGLLRIVSSSTKCKSYETPLAWNIFGPQGPVGPQGPQGPAGGQNGLPFVCNSCDLSTRVNQDQSIFTGNYYTSYGLGSLFSGKDLSRAFIRNTAFDGTDLSNAVLKNAILEGTSFNKTNLTGAILTNANLQGADIRGSNLTNANLQGAWGINEGGPTAEFDNTTIFNNTICPDGTNSNAVNPQTCAGHFNIPFPTP